MRHSLSVALLALGCALCLSGESGAHDVPSRRTVTVQAEPDGAAVLIVWTSARGPEGAQLLGRAAWGRNKRALAALRALAAVEALRGLDFSIGGAAAAARSIDIKVRVDSGNGTDPPRLVCAVLVTFEVPPAADFVVATNGAAGLRWLDHSEGAAESASPASSWLAGKSTLRLHFRET